jgi:predicted acetyltransferase
MQIAVLPADDRQVALANLIQLYLYDLRDLEESDASSDGRFEDAALDKILAESGGRSFLICIDDRLLGFASISRHSRLRSDFEGTSFAAFFILRRYRRHGYGRAAAIQLINAFPGSWEIATFGANVPALSFWRSVADEYTAGRYQETWHQDPNWRGSIQTFDATPTPVE